MRATLIVLDSAGAGAMPDAERWGDVGSDTLGHVAEARGGLKVPNLAALGLGNIRPTAGVPVVAHPDAGFGKMATASPGKDTITGHWELAGCQALDPFSFFPDGFPPEVMDPFERFTGRPSLGNKAASGTIILEELGVEHMATGRPIIYTSADSVFQVAAHEDVVPLPLLYAWCEEAFRIVSPRRVARVIARPFVGQPGAFQRTYNRKDYAMQPHAPTVMDALQAVGMATTGIGKTASIFGGRGFDLSRKGGGNDLVVSELLDQLDRQRDGFIFVNMVDFDSKYGHRRNVQGYGDAIEVFDAQLPEIMARLGPDDLLILTADHGCDPTFRGTDHTREYVPLLAWQGGRAGALGTRSTLSDAGASVASWLGVAWDGPGVSFMDALRRTA